MNRRIFILTLVAVFALAVALPAQYGLAAKPAGSWFQPFEKNTAGWFPFSGGTIYRVPSFYSSTASGGYADGVPSASGRYHARLGLDPDPQTCTFGGGTAPIYRGPYTEFGGPRNDFPPGGYMTQLDIYLDMEWALAHPDARFDWDSANLARDYIFNAGTDPLGFVISASNNGSRCDSFPANPGRMPQHITVSGWYTFEHVFEATDGGPITATMRIIRRSTGAVVASWVLIGGETAAQGGGWQYGLFVQNEIPELAVDNTFRTILCRNGDADGELRDNNGRNHRTQLHKNQCKDDGHVQDDELESGRHFESTSVTSSTFTTDEDSRTLTMIGTGLDGGLPVGFTMVAVDSGDLAPSIFTLTLTNGRTITGSFVTGGLAID